MSDAAERLYERVLVVRCQTGEPAALAELIARYGPRLRFYLAKMAGDGVADDLLQDVWVNVFANIARLNDAGAFGGWVYRIARDKAYCELRRRRTPMLPFDEASIEAAIGEAEDETDWTAEDVERVRAALDRLPPEQREVLVLQFVEDMNYEQIAALIACPVGTVRSRIHYAKRALRSALDESAVRKDVRI
jgi:RNA polymerase sigma-70 factor, ECF subfamily